MRRYDYPPSIAAGTIAAGGTLGAMFPPSTVLVVYGIITDQDIGRLFLAGIVPGLIAVAMYIATLALIGVVRPAAMPAGPRFGWADRLARLQGRLGVVGLVRICYRRPLWRPVHRHRGGRNGGGRCLS